MIQGAAEAAGVPPPPGKPLEREWLTPGEVAAMLQLSDKTIYRLAKADPTLPVVRIGKGKNATVRFHRARLERWLLDRLQGAARSRRLTAAREPAGREAGA